MKGKIKIQPKKINNFNNRKTINFQIEGVNEWYMYEAPEEKLGQAIPLLRKGTEITFNPDKQNTTKTLEIEKIAEPEKQSEKQPEKHWANEMVTFKELLAKAHHLKIKEITTEMLSSDIQGKTAIFKAKVTLESEASFEATGDATPGNVSNMILPHFIRMAETRAIARALRLATNNGDTCDIETEDPEDETMGM